VKRRVIFHISANVYPPLNTAHHTRAIWDELSRDADTYHIIARGLDNGWHHDHEGNLHLHRLPAFGSGQKSFLLSQWLLLILCMKYRPTHLLAQCPVLGGLAAALWAWLARVPLLVELHGTHYFEADQPGLSGRLRHKFYRFASILTFTAARTIRTLSQDMTVRLSERFGTKVAARALDIPPRVNLEYFYPKQDYAVGDKLKLICVGGLVPNKNHVALIDDLAAAGIPLTLTIAGSGPLHEHLAAQVLALAARGVALHLAGEVDHKTLARLLHDSDIYVHYSLAEGVPRAILEAMAAGLPVITSPAGFLAGVIDDGANGLILRAHGAAPLRSALQHLATRDVRERMGRSARKTVQEKFEWHRVFNRYRAALYGELGHIEQPR
jgi:glycosyltransferase involved in cell wall biosynthesis